MEQTLVDKDYVFLCFDISYMFKYAYSFVVNCFCGEMDELMAYTGNEIQMFRICLDEM